MSDYPSLTDEQGLIAGALGGDEEALGQVLRTSQDWAYHVAYRVLGQEADARDAVQDAFLLTVRAIRGDGAPPRSTDGFRPWLRRVVVNSALTQVRRRPTLHTVPVEDVAESLPGSARDEPGRTTDQEETRSQVLQALLSLPETQRAALALRELLDASYEEIADVLGIPHTAVGTLLFRARAGFRASYDRLAQTAGPVDCPDIVPLFSAIIDNQPQPAAWSELERHLQACARCRGELESQRRARRLYALIPLAVLPAGWEPALAALNGTGAAASQASLPPDTGLDAAAASDQLQSGASSLQAAGPTDLKSPLPDPGGSGLTSSVPMPDVSGSATTAPLSSAGSESAVSAGLTGSAGPVGLSATHAAGATGAAGTTSAVAAGSAASVATTTGGLLGIVSGAKLGIAALAAATVVGAAIVIGPQRSDDGASSAAVPSPVAELLASPPPAPGLAASPAAASGVAVSPSPSPLAVPPVNASPGALPSPTVTGSPGPASAATAISTTAISTVVPSPSPLPAPRL